MEPQAVLDPKREVDPAAEAQWEATLRRQCGAAGLSPFQREVVLLTLVDRMNPGEIRLKLRGHLFPSERRVVTNQAVKFALVQGCKKLAGRFPECWREASQFRRDLVSCVANRRDCDVRDPDQRGVTPAHAGQRYQGAPVVTASHPKLRQDPETAVRLWATRTRPALVERLADA